LGLGIAMTARSAAGRAAALAFLPVLALTAFLTISRTGMLATVIGLAAALLLTPQRGRWLGKAALAAGGAAILIKGALQRDELRDGLRTPVAFDQGDELLVLALVVGAGIALVSLGLSHARAAGMLPVLARRRLLPPGYAWGAVAAAAVAAVVLLVASGEAGERWDEFKDPDVGYAGDDVRRFTSVSGEGRYFMWRSSLEAFEQAPLGGLGAGSFQNWWGRTADYAESVRNAHSLYAETAAELGLIGLVLLVGLIALVLAAGVRGVVRATGPPAALTAAVTAACCAFVAGAAVDWFWQVTVLPAVFLLLAAALVAGDGGGVHVRQGGLRAGIAVLALLGLAALAVPLAATTSLRSSQTQAAADKLGPALVDAHEASRVQPYAASPLLQRALVLELRGNLDAAVVAARAAQRKEPTSWRPPFVLARLEARRGNTTAGLAALRRAKALNKTGLLR